MGEKIEISRRDFLAISGAVGGAMMAGGCSSLLPQGGGGGAPSVAIIVDESNPATKQPPVQWAVGRLTEVLRQRGVAVGPDGQIRVMVQASSVHNAEASGSEQFSIKPAKDGVAIQGSDARGLVYALTELADRLEHGADVRAALSQKTALAQKPANPIRGMFRMFASEREDKGWYYDRDTWQRYFDFLVAQRFNRFNLSFGLTYDFSRNVTDAYTFFMYPFFVNVPGYAVKAIGRNGAAMPEEEQRKNLETLKFISNQAALRGLDFNLGIWTHSYQWTNSPNATHTIAGLNDETQAPYSRDAMRLLLTTCPGVTGVTLRTHGESGIPEGSYDKWKIIMSGVTGLKNADGTPRVIELDLHGKTMTQEMIDTALGTDMPVTISCKFSSEHWGLPYVQASIRESEMPKGRDAGGLMALSSGTRSFLRYGIGDLLRKGRTYKVIHRVWPGTQRLLMWGDPVFAAEMGKAASFAGMDGIEFFEPLSFKGRAGSSMNIPAAPDRSGYADASLRVPAAEGGEMFKYAYTLRVLGRHAYDPSAPAESCERGMPDEHLRAALANASRITLLMTTAHLPCASCALFWPEAYTNQSLYDVQRNPYSEAPSPKIFANVSPLDPQIFGSVAEFAEAVATSEPFPRITPLHVATQLQQWGTTATDAIARWQESRGASMLQASQLTSAADRRAAIDASIAAEVGRFFAHKLVAATCLAIYDRTGYEPAISAARDYYAKAVARWERIAELSRVYLADLTYGNDRLMRGQWSDRLPEMKNDLAGLTGNRARQALQYSKESIDQLLANPWRSAQKLGSVEHISPRTFKAGAPVSLALGGTGDYTGRLLYRHVHQGERYQAMPLVKTRAGLAAEIPGGYTQSPFPIAYYFELMNDKNAFIYPGFAADFVGQPYHLLTQTA